MNTFTESIQKDFHYEFPEIINLEKVRKYTFDLSVFTEEEKEFYKKYAGSYIPEYEFSKEYLTYHLSEFEIRYIKNDIIFVGFTKSFSGIDYDLNSKKFYESDGVSASQIKNFSQFSLPSYFEKNKFFKIKNYDAVTKVINQKKQKMNRPPLKKSDEIKIRELLIGFYSLLGKKEFNKIIDTYFESTVDKENYESVFFLNYTDLYLNTSPFEIYINTFFNDDIDKYDEDTIFVELKYRHAINYVSFAIKKINGEYKIIQYVGRYDEE